MNAFFQQLQAFLKKQPRGNTISRKEKRPHGEEEPAAQEPASKTYTPPEEDPRPLPAYTQEQALELHLRVEELQELLVESQARIANLSYNLSAAQASAQAAKEEAQALQRLRSVEYKGETRDITPHVKDKIRTRGEVLRVHFFCRLPAPKDCHRPLRRSSASSQQLFSVSAS